jgi:hypothetical protein
MLVSARKSLLFFCKVAVSLGVVASQTHASPIFQIVSGDLTLSYSSETATYDIRGAALLSVTDIGLTASPLALFDSTGGTDPTYSVLPFGNTVLTADDSNSGNSGIEDLVFFDFTGLSLSSSITVDAYSYVYPTTDTPTPTLAELINNSPVAFDFSLVSINGDPTDGYTFQWDLTSVEAQSQPSAAPEPVSSLLMGTGMLGIGLALQVLRTRKRAD